MAVVVLPTPPFWLATTRTRGGFLAGSSWRELPDLQNDPGRMRQAGMLPTFIFQDLRASVNSTPRF